MKQLEFFENLIKLPDLILHTILCYLDHIEDIDAILILFSSNKFTKNEKVLQLIVEDTSKSFMDILYENNNEKYKYLRSIDISKVTSFTKENIPYLTYLKKIFFNCGTVQLSNYSDKLVVCNKCYKLVKIPNLPRLNFIGCVTCNQVSTLSDFHVNCNDDSSDSSDSSNDSSDSSSDYEN